MLSAINVKLMLKNLSNIINKSIRRIRVLSYRPFQKTFKIEAGPGEGLHFDAGSDIERFVTGQYERPIQEAIQSLVKIGDVCYDIGANLGFFSLLFGRFAGMTGTVYAFEPVPKNALMIEKNVRSNEFNNIKIMRIALSRNNGKDELLLAHHIGGAVLKSAGTPPDLAGSLIVETASIDTLVKNRDIKPPSIVKIDVEGAEMDVLHGMEWVLRKYGPVIILEVDDETAVGCEKKLSSCQAFLHHLNYQTKLLPNAYPDGRWFVRHFLALQESCF